MSAVLGITDYAVIAIMLAISASIGLFFRFTGGRQKTTKEFLMAGKDMHIFPVAFSLMATYMSAISLLGVPSETYLYGTQLFVWMIGMPIGGIIAGYGFLPVFFDMDVTTAYEYLEKRFGKLTRSIASVFFIIQMILYMAVVLYAPALALNAVTSLSTWTSVISLAVVCTFYCSLGGLKAVLWTDVFQSMLMYTTIIIVVIKATIDLKGIQEMFRIADEGGRFIFLNTTFDLTVRYTLWNAILAGIYFSVNTFGANQAQIQRMLSVGDLKRAQKALLWSLPLTFLYNVFNFLDGVVIYAKYYDCDPMLDENTKLGAPDQLMPFAIMEMFSHLPGLAGLCITGVFSASLSTISSAVNSLTAVTMEDFIRPYCFCKRLTEDWATFLAKILAIGYGGLCLLLTYIVANFSGVLEASSILTGIFGSPIFGVYLLGMFSKIANEKGTLIGLVAGFIINAWQGFGSYAYKPKVLKLPQSIEGCLISNSTFNDTNYMLNSTIESHFEHLEEEEERYISPFYRVSFVWFPMIGTITVVIVGYIASFIIGFFAAPQDIIPDYFSPFVRKMHFKNTKSSNETNNPQVEMEEKYSKGIHKVRDGNSHTDAVTTT